MVDGSHITTHNNDCQECDIRITHVPARDWPAGTQRPIHLPNAMYPRYIESAEENIHGPDYLIDNVDLSIFPWTVRTPMAYIPQVAHTYAYTLGTYALQNEKQVSIGESTCSAIWSTKPLALGGKALLHMNVLTELGLERCDTARCAIQTMGDLATQYGFYADASTGDEATAKMEAGEALFVADTTETWMFHILPDDTGTAAVWVAQRVPDDHIAACANSFTIGEIDVADTKNFLASDNIFEVAERNNLWSAANKDKKPFKFDEIYGQNYDNQVQNWVLCAVQFCSRCCFVVLYLWDDVLCFFFLWH
jgi:dipeptidase